MQFDRNLLLIILLLALGSFFGALSIIYFPDFFQSVVLHEGSYGTITESDFFSFELAEIQSGKTILVQCHSNKVVTVGITGVSNVSSGSLDDFYVAKNGTNVNFSWDVDEVGDYFIVLVPHEAGETRFSVASGIETANSFPFMLFSVEIALLGVSVGLFYFWYKVLVDEEKIVFKGRMG